MKRSNKRVRKYFDHFPMLHTSVGSQNKTLKKLLIESKDSAFGKYYHFENMLESRNWVEQFKNSVPLHRYQELRSNWWDKSNNNEHNTWKGNFKYLALSSGTSNSSSKRLPVTEETLKLSSATSVKFYKDLLKFDIPRKLFLKDRFMLGGSLNLKEDNGVKYGDLSGILTSNIPPWLQRTYRPGVRIGMIDDWNDRIEEIVKDAPNWDVSFLFGMPSWLLLSMQRIMDYHNLSSIHQIWPNLTAFVHGGVYLKPYKEAIEAILDKPITYVNTYLASEGFIAYQKRPETNSMSLNLNSGIYFEFIEYNIDDFSDDDITQLTKNVISIQDVEEGKNYVLLLSNTNGLWRYIIGDVVRFSDKERLEIDIVGRVSHYLNICGEHISIENINQAVKLTEETLNVKINDFTVYASVTNNNRAIHKWYVSFDETIDLGLFSTTLDNHLRQLNDDYITERNNFLEMEVKQVPSKQFYNWMELNNKLGGQNKFPTIMKGNQIQTWENLLSN